MRSNREPDGPMLDRSDEGEAALAQEPGTRPSGNPGIPADESNMEIGAVENRDAAFQQLLGVWTDDRVLEAKQVNSEILSIVASLGGSKRSYQREREIECIEGSYWGDLFIATRHCSSQDDAAVWLRSRLCSRPNNDRRRR